MRVVLEVCVAGAVAILVIAEALALAHRQGTARDTSQRIIGPAGGATPCASVWVSLLPVSS